MHDVAHIPPVERARTGGPTCWIGVMPLAVRCVSALICLGRRLVWDATPRCSRAGSEQAECYGSEQCPFRATGWQLDTDARDVLDHARQS
jgi:hypothetical protein